MKGKIKDKYKEIFLEIDDVFENKLQITPFLEQKVAAQELIRGNILEMYTGEGKSIVNVLAAILLLKTTEYKKIHIYTTNSYLAKRDFIEFKDVFEAFNLKAEVLFSNDSLIEKQVKYRADIIYVDSHTIGFDYLRQNCGTLEDNIYNRFFNKNYFDDAFAIVDEIDSILLDKGNTPLIISSSEEVSDKLGAIDKIVSNLTLDKHYTLEKKQVSLTKEGIKLIENRLMLSDSLYSKNNIRYAKHIYNALKAHYTMFKDVDYIVEKNEVTIIDAMTGRKQEGQKYSDGLHQAIEVKENIEVSGITSSSAMTTIQSHFKMYKDFGGLTGTAVVAKKEFKELFNKRVVVIDRRLPLRRVDETYAFLTKQDSLDYLLNKVRYLSMDKTPILIGCQTIEESENVSTLLKQHGFKINLLNAKTHEKEAEIISNAGNIGQITVATNMAGRGTDIKLEDKHRGLAVIGLGLSISPRIDLQLRGRSGRQGDIGSSLLLISLEDDFLVNNVEHDKLNKVTKIVKQFADVDSEYYLSKFIVNKLLSFQEVFDFNQSEARCDSAYYDFLLAKNRTLFYNKRIEFAMSQEITEDEREDSELLYKLDNADDILSNIDSRFKNHLNYFNNVKKTIGLTSYNGLDKKLEMQLLLNKHFSKTVLQALDEVNLITKEVNENV